ncbi:hypothetical protein [Salinisphaera sp.]|uniref:hypothetical protein n=1 Tax=Salinisphaera sp. TaxID=1914330 RepID=UPI000C545AF6|nr:hypothetical protein [Salinisphaera sp.]MAS09949.1 hypothetical protein [Salinisphaera sp.]|tara:strand:+ start:15648 stop:16163 length:516 start_codon:yes stop_codon:yes gene_type:complete
MSESAVNEKAVLLDTEAYLGFWGRRHETAQDVTDARATFYFADDDDIEPLTVHQTRKGKGKKEPGKRMRLIVIELDDNEAEVPQPSAEQYAHVRGGKADDAIAKAQAPLFQQFLIDMGLADKATAHYAGEAIKTACGISTRKALDHDDTAAAKYDAIAQHYSEWLSEREGK